MGFKTLKKPKSKKHKPKTHKNGSSTESVGKKTIYTTDPF